MKTTPPNHSLAPSAHPSNKKQHPERLSGRCFFVVFVVSNGQQGAGHYNPKARQAGSYKLKVRLSADKGASDIECVLGDQVLPVTVPSTGSWDKYQEVEVGRVNLPAGASQLSVRCRNLKGPAPCNLGSLKLTPE